MSGSSVSKRVRPLKVLVTGAGALLGQGIIRALRTSKLDARIVAVDPSPVAAGLYWADSAHLIRPAVAPDYLDRMREVLHLEEPAVILPGTDVELALLASVRVALETDFNTHVIVSSPDVIQIADDKWQTYEFLRDQGLGFVPSCLPGREEHLIAEVGFPLLVKPRIGARSVGVRVVRNRSELDDAIEARPDLIIQKYVGSDDTEFTAGTLTFDGTCRASIVMRRELRDGNTFRAYVQPYEELNHVVRGIAERLRPYGPANFQFRLDGGEPKVFEINGRFSGTTPLRALAGFNEVEMTIRHVVYGEPIRQPDVSSVILLRHWSETVVTQEGLVAGAASRPGGHA